MMSIRFPATAKIISFAEISTPVMRTCGIPIRQYRSFCRGV